MNLSNAMGLFSDLEAVKREASPMSQMSVLCIDCDQWGTHQAGTQ